MTTHRFANTKIFQKINFGFGFESMKTNMEMLRVTVLRHVPLYMENMKRAQRLCNLWLLPSPSWGVTEQPWHAGAAQWHPSS